MSTSRWTNLSSYGFIKLVATSVHTFDFEETWIHRKGLKWVGTIGKGTYELSTGLNICDYSKPRGVWSSIQKKITTNNHQKHRGGHNIA